MVKTLCQNCRFLESTEFVGGRGKAYCKKLYQFLHSYAVRCRQYQDIRQPSLDDMYQSAWILTKSKQAGYMSPTLNFDAPKEGSDVRRNVNDSDR